MSQKPDKKTEQLIKGKPKRYSMGGFNIPKKPTLEQDELLLTLNEWLDLFGIDRAYKKDMKQTYEQLKPSLEAQLAKVKQHYEQKIKGILEEIESRWGWSFDKDVWQAYKKEVLEEKSNV